MGYDVVVVGGGSAGCALAGRLSEDEGISVLLLEAGPRPRRLEAHVPAAYPRLFQTRLDWNYRTSPEPGLEGRDVYWPRARVLGGCSAMNAMIYMRGSPADYDGWAAQGLPGWSWADVLPVFMAAEDNQRGASEYHGADGVLPVSDQVTRGALSHAFVAAADEWGLTPNDDFNGRTQDGVGWFQVTQRNGRRISAASAYLRPARRRANLTVVTGATARKVLFSGTRASGVSCTVAGRRRDFFGGEVVLSAGAVNSPQLLMLSGLGPSADLASLGVGVRVDLPWVGGNLQDHASVGVVGASATASLGTAAGLRSLARYTTTRRGPYASNIVEAGAFLRSDPSLTWPDLQLHFAPVLVVGEGTTMPTEDGYVMWACVLDPHSRGRVRLASADPSVAPLIEAGYLTDPNDLERTVTGLRSALEICSMPSLARHTTRAVEPERSDVDLATFVRRRLQSLYHPVGTCAMGRVVDADLRVYGVQALRVADASVMPTIPHGNTNAPAMMIGERAAALVRGGAVG